MFFVVMVDNHLHISTSMKVDSLIGNTLALATYHNITDYRQHIKVSCIMRGNVTCDLNIAMAMQFYVESLLLFRFNVKNMHDKVCSLNKHKQINK